jgi:hypothetical protein
MPFDSWLKKSLYDVLEDTFSPDVLKRRGYFCVNEAEGIKKRFMAGEMSWVFPWLLIITELWCRELLDLAWKQDCLARYEYKPEY